MFAGPTRIVSPCLFSIGRIVSEKKLTAKARKHISKGNFAVPEKSPKSGSYPIQDIGHAKAALGRAAGKTVEPRVRAAVFKKYPSLKK